jgi:hypothetical protein
MTFWSKGLIPQREGQRLDKAKELKKEFLNGKGEFIRIIKAKESTFICHDYCIRMSRGR